MRRRRSACVAGVAVLLLHWCAAAPTLGLMLTRYSELGFLRLMHMARHGQLGGDVVNANVGIVKDSVRLELVVRGVANRVLLLMPAGPDDRASRYFHIEPQQGASAEDVARVGRALDEAFGDNPFQIAPGFFNVVPGRERMPDLAEVWEYAGWRGVLLVGERRIAEVASLPYTVTVILVLVGAVAASLFLLWASPPPDRASSDRRSGAQSS